MFLQLQHQPGKSAVATIKERVKLKLIRGKTMSDCLKESKYCLKRRMYQQGVGE